MLSLPQNPENLARGGKNLTTPNFYALVLPVNSTRIICEKLGESKIETDFKVTAVGHSHAINMESLEIPEIDATYLMTAQPTLTLSGKTWIKPRALLKQMDRYRIKDLPINQLQLFLPSNYDGKKHRCTFSLLNTHSQLFKKSTASEKLPWTRIFKIHADFVHDLKAKLSPSIFRFMKSSVMLLTDTNPGKQEMYQWDFVKGLKQPFMESVVSTKSLWECIDYEVF